MLGPKNFWWDTKIVFLRNPELATDTKKLSSFAFAFSKFPVTFVYREFFMVYGV